MLAPLLLYVRLFYRRLSTTHTPAFKWKASFDAKPEMPLFKRPSRITRALGFSCCTTKNRKLASCACLSTLYKTPATVRHSHPLQRPSCHGCNINKVTRSAAPIDRVLTSGSLGLARPPLTSPRETRIVYRSCCMRFKRRNHEGASVGTHSSHECHGWLQNLNIAGTYYCSLQRFEEIMSRSMKDRPPEAGLRGIF